MNGTPSVKVVQYHRDGSSVFPCRWFASVGIYKVQVPFLCGKFEYIIIKDYAVCIECSIRNRSAIFGMENLLHFLGL